jgi:hypothetical protein
MNEKLIRIICFIIVIICIILYFIYYKLQPIEEHNCRLNINESYYSFDNHTYVLGSQLMNYNFKSLNNIENFALSSNIFVDPKLLNPYKYYSIGNLIISNTLTKQINEGVNNCIEFPLKAYKEAPQFFTTNIPFPKEANVNNATSCQVSSCTLESQICPPNVAGANGITRICKNNTWVSYTSSMVINTIPTKDVAVNSISYNKDGVVLVVGKTSGLVYRSTNFGTSSQTFTLVPSGTVTFSNASIGMGNFVVGGRVGPTNDNLLYSNYNITNSNFSVIYSGSYHYGVQNAVGTVPGIQGYTVGAFDNVLLCIGTNGDLYLQQQGAYWYRWLFSQQPGKVNSISLDQTVATAVMYTEGSISKGILPVSTIFMISFQPGGNVSKAPGGIGAEIATANTSSFKKVVGNPNNITYLCAGEDLRAFAVTDTGSMLICNDITKAKTLLDWVVLPAPPSVKFSKVFYRKTLSDIAYAIDINGQIYVQNGVNAIFKQMFNLPS